MNRIQRSLLWFRELLDRFPEHAAEASRLCMGSPTFRKTIHGDPQFALAFEQWCPELLHTAEAEGR